MLPKGKGFEGRRFFFGAWGAGARSLSLGFALAMLLAASANAAETAVFTIEECVAIALRSHPSLAEAGSRIDSQAAAVGLAAAGGRPQASAGPSYSYAGSDGSGQGGQFNTDISLRQEIYDWGRRDLSIEGARQELDARARDYENTVETVVRDVMDAYYSLNRSGRAERIASERLGNYRQRLQWAEEFYRVGTKPKIEVTKAQTDLSRARLDLVNAQGAQNRAAAALAAAMGIPEAARDEVADMLAFAPYEVGAEEAIQRAAAARADLRAQDLRVEGARSSLALAKKGLAPTLSGSAGYSFSGESNPFDQDGWRVSMGLEFPLLDGGATKEEIRRAEASLSGAEASRESLRQGIVLQVRTAHASLTEAAEAVSAANEAERQARETLALAQGRYKAGVGSSLEISDAVETYAQARTSVVTALYNHKAAEVELKRVMGVIADGFGQDGQD